MPRDVKPMLATLTEAPFDRAGWLFELKWDGYRAIAEVTRRRVRLYSRNLQPFEQRFAPIVRALHQLGHEAVLDGEVVVVDEHGKSHFQLLQNYQKTGKGRLVYYVFDLIYLDGRDLRGLPLAERKELLREALPNLRNVRLSEHVSEGGVAFFEAAAAAGLEGIIGKDGASPYRSGVRSREWLKIKTHQRQEAVIAGFTEPRGSRKDLGALILGVYEGDELIYVGHTGGGFDRKGLTSMRGRLEPLIQEECPFRRRPPTNAPAHWLRPELVCEVSFHEWTGDGVMRQPIFLGLREDKDPHSVRREVPIPAGVARPPGSRVRSRKSRAERSTATPNGSVHKAAPSGNGKGIALTNLAKAYWPADGYTKGDLIAYYREVAPFILPYLQDRPLSLHRHPNGIEGKSFFQKDVSHQPPPSGVPTTEIHSEGDGRAIRYIVGGDERTLLYLANLGCIEMNPWNSRLGSLQRPDYVVIDLDPEDISFAHVVAAAREVRKVLARADADSHCKTSGKRGLHVYVPLGAKYDYDQARVFAEIVANVVHGLLPGTTSVVRSPALRQGRVYLDFLQNRRGQTLAAPYSARPAPGAPVSTPLKWSEVTMRLNPAQFTIQTMRARLDKVGDLWGPVLGAGVDLRHALERLAKLQRREAKR
jgi:bifunctional non-homologous end joining protein LigD